MAPLLVANVFFLFLAQVIASVEVTKELYYQYLLDFDKDLNRLNDATHFELFTNNMEYIEQFNNCKLLSRTIENCSVVTFQVGLTQFTDMLSYEMDAYFGNSMTPANDYDNELTHEDSYIAMKRHMKKYKRVLYENDQDMDIFSSFKSLNWATMNNPLSKPIVTTVRNQGNCGACWAFVATTAIESTIYITTGYDVKLRLYSLFTLSLVTSLTLINS